MAGQMEKIFSTEKIPPMEQITSRENRAVKEYKKLAGSKSKREAEGRFVIESVKLVAEAVNSGVEIEKVFVTQLSLEKNYEALQKLFEQKGPAFYQISREIEEKLTQTANAQGIFAVCKKLDKHWDIGKIKEDGKYIFLSRLQDTGNVGTIIRTAEAMGLDGVILSRDTCDVTGIKVLRASMGSAFRVNLFFCEDDAAALRRLGERFETYAAVLDPEAESLPQVRFPKNSILVIGNEGNGLSEQVADACRHKVMIPMKGNVESFNASMAAGIFMWEMMK